MEKKTRSVFDINGKNPVVTTETYNYNEYSLLSNITTSRSYGTTISKSLKYPADYKTTTTYLNMFNKNILSPIIDEITSITNGIEIERVKVNYKLENSLYVPESTQHSFTGASNLITVKTFNQYDIKGNLVQSTNIGGVPTTYIWGYNYRLLIAKVENASYSQVTSIISTTVLNNIASKSVPTTSDMQTLRNLVSGIPNAMVTTYTYKPLFGIFSETDPSGRVTSYEYDNSGRLIQVKDDAGKILKEYKYNYAQ